MNDNRVIIKSSTLKKSSGAMTMRGEIYSTGTEFWPTGIIEEYGRVYKKDPDSTNYGEVGRVDEQGRVHSYEFGEVGSVDDGVTNLERYSSDYVEKDNSQLFRSGGAALLLLLMQKQDTECEEEVEKKHDDLPRRSATESYYDAKIAEGLDRARKKTSSIVSEVFKNEAILAELPPFQWTTANNRKAAEWAKVVLQLEDAGVDEKTIIRGLIENSDMIDEEIDYIFKYADILYDVGFRLGWVDNNEPKPAQSKPVVTEEKKKWWQVWKR